MATLTFGLAAGPAQAASTTTSSAAPTATRWYLALGDSVATGYQPDVDRDDPNGGYVGPVLAELGTQTELRNLACDGESSTTMIEGGGHCSYERSQLAQALGFLRAHAATTRLVTITIGGNDVLPCVQEGTPEAVEACVNKQLPVLASNLQRILEKVHAAAPTARIITTNYYNPILAFWFTNPDLATSSTSMQLALNDTIESVTAKIDPKKPDVGATADVETEFRSTDTTLVDGVPINVSTICAWTWMCNAMDDHPNSQGFQAIARTVVAKLEVAQ